MFLKTLFSFYLIFFIGITTVYSAEFQNGSFEEDDTLWTNELSNIDFLNASEQDLTGWTIEILAGDKIDWFHDGTAQEGSYHIQLAGTPATARVSQIFDTVSGREYEVVYYLKSDSASPYSAHDHLITLRDTNGSGTILTSRTDRPTGSQNWEKFTITFTASSTSTYISFENLNNTYDGTYLDNVYISPDFEYSQSLTVYDPLSENHKAVPGENMVIQGGLTNNGGGLASSDDVSLTFRIPTAMAYQLNSMVFVDGEIVGAGSGNPANDGIPINPTGMTCCTGAEITYSSNGTSFSYTPSVSFTDDFGNTYDSNIRAIRITPSGAMNSGVGSPVGFRAYYQAQIL